MKVKGFPQVAMSSRLGDDSPFFQSSIERESIPHTSVVNYGFSSLALILPSVMTLRGEEPLKGG